MEPVKAVRARKHHRPAATIGQSRSQRSRPNVLGAERGLVDHDPIEAETTQAIGIVAGFDRHAATVRKFNTPLHFVDRHRRIPRRLLQIPPDFARVRITRHDPPNPPAVQSPAIPASR